MELVSKLNAWRSDNLERGATGGEDKTKPEERNLPRSKASKSSDVQMATDLVGEWVRRNGKGERGLPTRKNGCGRREAPEQE
jgi:hypothetical protein